MKAHRLCVSLNSRRARHKEQEQEVHMFKTLHPTLTHKRCVPNMQRFRGGLVMKAHRLCVALNSRLDSNKEEEDSFCCRVRYTLRDRRLLDKSCVVVGHSDRICATAEPPFHWNHSNLIGRVTMVQEEVLWFLVGITMIHNRGITMVPNRNYYDS